MNVAIVTSEVVRHSGQGRVALELARYLADAGHEVHLYASMVDDELLSFSRIHFHRIRIHVRKPELLRNLCFLFHASRLLQHTSFDIIHLNGANALIRHHVNTVHLLHRGWLNGGFSERPGLRGSYHRVYRHFNAWLERVVLSRTQVLVGVSEKVAEESRLLLNLPTIPVRVIPNAADVTRMTGLAHDVRQLIWPGLSDQDLLFGFAGDLRTTIKGVDTLLLAVARRPDLPIRMVLAGTVDGSPYPAMARRLGLEGRVRFLGFRHDLLHLMSALDCFVYPTRYDTFGLVVTEAASVGCPLIISGPAYCGAASLFNDGDSAILLSDPDDPQELGTKLEIMAKDNETRRRFGERAKAAVSIWTWVDMGRRYEALYKEVLASHASLRHTP